MGRERPHNAGIILIMNQQSRSRTVVQCEHLEEIERMIAKLLRFLFYIICSIIAQRLKHNIDIGIDHTLTKSFCKC